MIVCVIPVTQCDQVDSTRVGLELTGLTAENINIIIIIITINSVIIIIINIIINIIIIIMAGRLLSS